MPERPDLPELLADSVFRALLGEMARRCVPWEEFLGLPQPHGMSPLDTWSVLSDISRCEGVPIRVPDPDDNVYWYRRTFELDDAVTAISSACHPNDRLHRVMTANAGQHFLIASRIDETIAAAQLDGIDISEEDASVLLRPDRLPRSDTERLFVNTFAAFDGLPALVGEPFSRALFEHLRDLLLDGVDPAALRTRPRRWGLDVGFDDPSEDDERQHLSDRRMNALADYLNKETSDPNDLPVLQCLLAPDLLRYYRPFGVVSGQVGRLVAGLFALKNDLPLLGLLPLSRANINWEAGIIAPPLVSLDREMYTTLLRRGRLDSTPYLTLAAQFALLALTDLKTHIDAWERRDAEMREILRKDPLVNQRQRSILARALRDPEAEFQIRYHQTNHSVHYMTAHRDLFELWDKGYLVAEMRGKAYVFLRGPRLDELEALASSGERDEAAPEGAKA